MKKDMVSAVTQGAASQLIDARIKELDDWRGEMLGHIRMLIHQADPDVVEEWKWRGVPVWSHAGIICTGETYKSVVKMTFARGASLNDPSKIFNSSLEGNTRRAIDDVTIRWDAKPPRNAAISGANLLSSRTTSMRLPMARME